jgi:hypothetical protein
VRSEITSESVNAPASTHIRDVSRPTSANVIIPNDRRKLARHARASFCRVECHRIIAFVRAADTAIPIPINIRITFRLYVCIYTWDIYLGNFRKEKLFPYLDTYDILLHCEFGIWNCSFLTLFCYSQNVLDINVIYNEHIVIKINASHMPLFLESGNQIYVFLVIEIKWTTKWTKRSETSFF